MVPLCIISFRACLVFLSVQSLLAEDTTHRMERVRGPGSAVLASGHMCSDGDATSSPRRRNSDKTRSGMGLLRTPP